MQRIKLFFWVLPSILGIHTFAGTTQKADVFFCYGKLDPLSVKGYSYVVLESKNYSIPDIKKFKKLNGKVLAYISLGEVNSQSKYYNKLKNNVLGKNEIWDSYYLNLQDAPTKETLFSIVEEILSDGYDGLFLDNIDNFCTSGPQHNQKQDVIDFISELDSKYPEHFILQNAGLEIIGQTHRNINGVVFESVATNYTFNDNVYRLREQSEYSAYLKKIKLVKRKYQLPIILIEYADNAQLHDEIINRISGTGFMFFIGMIDLQGIPNYQK